uniref:Reverse transcriptase domain-containing protein n=1 Tax=Tanacetum cinerariifolium TaxID=118510 RepID=A0A699I7I8_TANCI|nr:hypothetical protein [Tanacetum cinerariifolium]
MPTTRSKCRTTAASQGDRTCVQTDRGGERTDDQGGQGDDQGVEANRSVDGINDFSINITQKLQNLLHAIEDVRNVVVNNGRGGCSYKEFLACNLIYFDGKGGAIAYTRWTEKKESVHDMSGCEANQKVKYVVDSLIGKALTWWNNQVQTKGVTPLFVKKTLCHNLGVSSKHS